MKDFGMGFGIMNHFDNEGIKKFQEKWAGMTDEQKLEFMNNSVENMNRPRVLSVEHIDAHCEEWMKKTSDEKHIWVNEINEMRNYFNLGMGGHDHHHRFGFHGYR